MFTFAQHVATDLLLAVLLVGSCCISYVNGSSFVIDDERVKSIDISPALGRGYSVKTNQFHSICLDVDETTEPSYNYEYTYTDVSSALNVETNTKVSGKVKMSFGWAKVKAKYEAEVGTEMNTQTQIVMTTMRIERYYASVKENKSPLSEDAKKLVDKKDYVGFYKSCGPNYVRSIRRAQEVTAMFTFESTDQEVITNMKAAIKATAYGNRFSSNTNIDSSMKIDTSMSTLQIQIFGYGLGLDKDGSETLVATSLEQYNAAMSFAFTSMTRGNQGSAQTGMVYGIELVPWTDNTAFQAASNLHDTAENNAITWTVPHEMIPDAIGFVPETDPGTCKNGGHVADSFGKCCKNNDRKLLPKRDAVDDDEEVFHCEPVRRFPVDLLKQNLQRNGEHVAMMDSILHYKTFTIMTLERCIQVLRTFPNSEQNTYLETPDSVEPNDSDQDIRNKSVTVGDLKQFLNPKDDMASVDLLNMELDEYVDMYYSPCMAALFGMNADNGSDPGDTLDYFMMKQWNSHPECASASCVIPTNSWDNESGGCRASFGQKGTPAPAPAPAGLEAQKNKSPSPTPSPTPPPKCAKKFDSNARQLVCKRDRQKWDAKIAKLDGCWRDSTPFILIERYCTPRLSEKERPTPELPVEGSTKDTNDDDKIIAKCESGSD